MTAMSRMVVMIMVMMMMIVVVRRTICEGEVKLLLYRR